MSNTDTTTTAQTDDEAIAAAAAAAEEVESRARLMGWKDKTEFDRPPERWVSAEEFVRRGEDTLPILKQNYRQLETKFGEVASKLSGTEAALAANSAALEHLRDITITAEQRAFERAKREFDRDKGYLESQRDIAASQADVATVQRISKQLEGLDAPKPFEVKVAPAPVTPVQPAVQPNAPRMDPDEQRAVEGFVAAEAKWFKTDKEASAFASARYGTLLEERPELSHVERLAEVKRSVMKAYPQHFDSPAALRAASVATPNGSGGGPTRRSKEWTEADLDSATLKVARQTVENLNKGNKTGKPYTMKDYLSVYFQGQEKT